MDFFFDGTNNNKDRDEENFSDSNIARLYNTYFSKEELGFNRLYIPGVGTEFSEIGEEGESILGASSAFGCEGRVIFALLSLLNFLNRQSFQKNVFDENTVLALCRNDSSVDYERDREYLNKLGIQGGLLQSTIGSSSDRVKFLRRQCDILALKLKSGKPHIVECLVDVFGFSRGAAEARVFCSWLNELLIDGCLAGVPLQFRFVGIIDTVASAGFWSGGVALVSNSTGGHGAWASVEALRIPTVVQNCVHMVAMHELRRNFPLDAIGINGKLPPGCVQYAYPGSHSDVGGGYRPGELGIAAGDDSLKLSQIPLNHMFDCAKAAGVPLRKPRSMPGEHNPFAIHPELEKAFDDFISDSTSVPRPVYGWLQPYINWRWQIRDRFHLSSQVRMASQADKEILRKFNQSLINDAKVMDRTGKKGILTKYKIRSYRNVLKIEGKYDKSRMNLMDPEARLVYEIAQKAQPTSQSLATLFDNYVHDSLAGFNSPILELPGYWRYRKIFLGTDDHVIAANQEKNAVRDVA